MPAPTLTTARLVLRQLREDDAAALFPVLSDPGGDDLVVERAAHSRLPRPPTMSKAMRPRVMAISAGRLPRGDDVALGWVILIDGKPDVKEIGYILHRDRWGNGIAREAVARVIDHGFGELGNCAVSSPIPIPKIPARSGCSNGWDSSARVGCAVSGRRISAFAIR